MKNEEVVKEVKEMIKAEEDRLNEIAEQQSPVMVEGLTTTEYYCQIMSNPRPIVKIMLDWNYPLYKVLGEDAPDGMWDEMSTEIGVRVTGVDI